MQAVNHTVVLSATMPPGNLPRLRFDLLLTDVQMPGLVDGIQVAFHARQRHPDIPVIVVSGQLLNAKRLDSLGPRKIFVSKPYELPALVATLRGMLETEI